MWNTIFDMALSNGIWAVMFLALLVYELRDSRRRESKYQTAVEGLVCRLKTVEAVKDDTGKLVSAVCVRRSEES